MLNTLTKYPTTAFDPEIVSVLVAALDDAWRSIDVTKVLNIPGNSPEALREILAKHIIGMAKKGERNQERLRDGALALLSL